MHWAFNVRPVYVIIYIIHRLTAQIMHYSKSFVLVPLRDSYHKLSNTDRGDTSHIEGNVKQIAE